MHETLTCMFRLKFAFWTNRGVTMDDVSKRASRKMFVLKYKTDSIIVKTEKGRFKFRI